MLKKKILELIDSLHELHGDDYKNEIENIAELLYRKLSSNSGTLYTIGNGGSAADSQHFVTELIVRFSKNRRSLPAIALTTDSSVITAAGNDLGFDKIFSRQLEGVLKSNDILFSFSTSGQSKNIINAVDFANKVGATTISLTGKNENKLSKISNYYLLCPSHKTDNIQTLNQVIYHYICDYIDQKLLTRAHSSIG
tara:strand:- start:185 stop:772 length:588 start_codon:yes stop_codon:yes gene_type:complete